MDWLEAIPALARVALVLALVLALLRFKLHLGLSLLAGSLALALLFRVAPGDYGRAVWRGLFDPHTIYVVIFIVGIILLTSAMSACGQMDRLVERFRAMVGESRIMLWALPAAIGLLPMPGGAVFSAPMVDAATQRAGLSGPRKTAVNYWFRHVWEHFWPLYPGVILAVALTGSSFGAFVAWQFPLGVFMAVSGDNLKAVAPMFDCWWEFWGTLDSYSRFAAWVPIDCDGCCCDYSLSGEVSGNHLTGEYESFDGTCRHIIQFSGQRLP